jgi:hypothetical protein
VRSTMNHGVSSFLLFYSILSVVNILNWQLVYKLGIFIEVFARAQSDRSVNSLFPIILITVQDY